MFKYIIKLILICSTLAAISCTKSSKQQPSDHPSQPNDQDQEELKPAAPWDDTPTTFNIILTFNGTPTTIRFSDLKYNKIGAFSMDWDDGARSSLKAMKLFNEL